MGETKPAHCQHEAKSNGKAQEENASAHFKCVKEEKPHNLSVRTFRLEVVLFTSAVAIVNATVTVPLAPPGIGVSGGGNVKAEPANKALLRCCRGKGGETALVTETASALTPTACATPTRNALCSLCPNVPDLRKQKQQTIVSSPTLV